MSFDLGAAGYNVQMCFNGSASAGPTINLTGTVADGDVFVIAQSGASMEILAQADQTNGAGWFNGDDAVVLRKGTTGIDAIGQIGLDPGTEWGTGLTSTADNTLRRNAAVCAGDSNGMDAFDLSIDGAGGPGHHAGRQRDRGRARRKPHCGLQRTGRRERQLVLDLPREGRKGHPGPLQPRRLPGPGRVRGRLPEVCARGMPQCGRDRPDR